jgi:hypothetical protein
MNSRLHEAMIPVILRYYRPLPIVFKAGHSDQKSQVMEIFVTVQSGQVTSVVDVVQLGIAVSTKLQQVLKGTVAVATFRAVTTSGFGVIGVLVMVQS